MNIYHISEQAGVSIATVSRVLNGSSKVSPKTREKVLKVIKDTGYTPNVFARGLGLNTMKTIGILCTTLKDLQIADLVDLIGNRLRDLGYDTLISTSGSIIFDKKNALEHFVEKKVDAVIIIGNDFLELTPSDNQYISLAGSHFPIMLINGLLDAPNVWCTLCDEEKAIYTITEGLLKKGRQHLLFLFGSMTPSSISKLEGFKNANFVQNIPETPEYIHLCNDGHQSAYEYVKKLLAEQKPIDGIITTDDYLASGCIRAVLEQGLEVPASIEITGSGATILSQTMIPSITTINCRHDEVSKLAVNSLINIFSGINTPSRTLIPAEIIKNKSTR